MNAFRSIAHYIWCVWVMFKLLCKIVLWMMLPFYGLTALSGLIQGAMFVHWYTGTLNEIARLLITNLIDIKTLKFVSDASGYSFLDGLSPVYEIPQIQSPLDWTSQLGLTRPSDWSSQNVENMANLDSLYRITPPYDEEPWQHWVYLSAQMEPWRQPDGPMLHDPWDQTFVKLLAYRDTHEALGRSNFHYVSCHKSFLCASWRVTAPALLHFSISNTTESQYYEELPDHELVSVRVFELPLREMPIPGVFPSYFEQMRALTASNLTFWTTKDTYSHFFQMSNQGLRIAAQLEKEYPWTYGLLVKAEIKWTSLWPIDDTWLRLTAYFIPFLCSAVPTYIFKHAQALFTDLKFPETSETVPEGKDPSAHSLQRLLDGLSDEDKAKCRKSSRGKRMLRNIEAELVKDDWDTPEEIIKDLNSALGLDKDGKVKSRR
ncbi:uncharacterized protein FSUBG_10529 [Fusarium subglutinans]|uniref:Uncharacterized protein n=1 Tax=Gibberella subglutinans TaxID=42677 RepID=A0A8H5UK93_GIBSU|nr:uncharacterized protein FSUBG_10529 [Fusarium subglutinans]KAF5591228.1 hypothetical protein FSUBG_10529 [Fusarium subglutinans]